MLAAAMAFAGMLLACPSALAIDVSQYAHTPWNCVRVRQMARQFNVHLEGRLAERTRIARDLHDTMLQSFQAVLMKFQTIGHLLNGNEPARNALDSAVAQ